MSKRRGFNPDARVRDAAFAFQLLSDSVFTKGFLGPSLRENRGLPSVGVSSARRAGVIVDDNGKMRCPPGTPNANQFTDINMSNCMIPSAETVARNAAEMAANTVSKTLDGFKRGSFGSRKDRDKIPNAGVGFSNPNGFLEMRRVPAGNSVVSPVDGSQRELTTADDSVKHIFDGGQLSDIPEEHLVRSIMLNASDGDDESKRFRIIGTGGGINGMTRMRDNKTGALIGIKYIDGTQGNTEEAIREVASELVMEHLGYEPMPMRLGINVGEFSWGGESWNGLALVSELAHNRHAGKIESARISDRDSKYDYKVEPREVVRMAFADSVIQNPDRHEGNFLISREGNSRGQIVPIDNSAGLSHSDNVDDARTITRTPWGVGIDEAMMEYYEMDEDRSNILEDVREMQEMLRQVDTAQLQEQFEQLFTYLGTIGSAPSQEQKEAVFASIARMVTLSNPEQADVIAEQILPEWKRPNKRAENISEWANSATSSGGGIA